MASLVALAYCELCGATQLSNDLVLQGSGEPCPTDHQWAKNPPARPPAPTPQSPPHGMNRSFTQLPYQAECVANDELMEHKEVVEENITRTEYTIDRLQQRNDRWMAVINQDCDMLVQAVEDARQRLQMNLQDITTDKMDQLTDQLAQYNEHLAQTDWLLVDITRRIAEEQRNKKRKEGIVNESATTIKEFPQLTPVPIVLAVECQTQPFLEALHTFGGVLETQLGRLPTVQITNANAAQGVSYEVNEPQDNDWDEKINATRLNLQVEVQATAYAGQSLGWEVIAREYAKYSRATGTIKLDMKSLGRGRTLSVRARTIQMPSNDRDPVRISAWCDPVEIEARPVVPSAPIMVRLVNTENNKAAPFRAPGPDFCTAMQEAAKEKFKLSCDVSAIRLQIVKKEGKELVFDLSVEENPSEIFGTEFDKKAHVINVLHPGGGGGPAPPVQSDNKEQENGEVGGDRPPAPSAGFPGVLPLKIRSADAKGSPQGTVLLKSAERAHDGDWIAAVKARFAKKWQVDVEGRVDMYFVDDDGNRVKDVVQDADLIYAKEDPKARVVCAAS